jgi:hypothetical protein
MRGTQRTPSHASTGARRCFARVPQLQRHGSLASPAASSDSTGRRLITAMTLQQQQQQQQQRLVCFAAAAWADAAAGQGQRQGGASSGSGGSRSSSSSRVGGTSSGRGSGGKGTGGSGRHSDGSNSSHHSRQPDSRGQGVQRPRQPAHSAPGRLDARQLTAHVKSAPSPAELQRLLQDHAAYIDPIHASAAFVALKRLCQADRRCSTWSSRC